jgi:Ethanolamine ammonia-lyase heavy chain (EC 4.3.1.7)
MPYTHTIGAVRHVFSDLKTLLARATPLRSGDELAGVAARSAEERMAARMALADVPLAQFLQRGGGALRRRRSHPPDRRPARCRSLYPGRASDRRRLPRLAVV